MMGIIMATTGMAFIKIWTAAGAVFPNATVHLLSYLGQANQLVYCALSARLIQACRVREAGCLTADRCLSMSQCNDSQYVTDIVRPWMI